MLPKEIESLIRERIDVYLKATRFGPPRFGQRVLAKSIVGGVIQPYKLGPALFEEIESFSNGIFESIKLVIAKLRVSPYEGLQSDLIREFDLAFDECASLVRQLWLSHDRNNPVAATAFDASLNEIKAARHSDIKLLVAEISQTRREVAEPDRRTLNIQHFTGVLGDVTNSVVNVYDYNSIRSELKRLNIPRPDRSELEDILDELKTNPPATTKQSLIEKGKAWIVKNQEFLGAGASIVRQALGIPDIV
jgi:hypothetical protein